jgi:hypothetical protein
MRIRLVALTVTLSMLVTGLALAERGRARRSTRPVNHGDRAYRDALQFAERHRLPHFTVRSRGGQRLVVNVPSNKVQDWCQTFSKGKCYIEPFFTASNRSTPSWSYLRIGDRSHNKYGSGESYRTSLYSTRVAFPVSLTQQELSTCEAGIHTSTNGRWNYNGGDPTSSGRNCTNWLTYKIGQYTGVRTASVKHHMRSLVNGYHSDRMSVMAVMSRDKIQNFGQDQLQLSWH